MKVVLTGACGFVGSILATGLPAALEDLEIIGVDNLSRRGSELNRARLERHGVRLLHRDVRSATDVDSLPASDFVIDAAANPSVLAGVALGANSRQVMEHNLASTINLLEYCQRHRAGFILLSTSRVYSIATLSGLPMEVAGDTFQLAANGEDVRGLSPLGVAEDFSTEPPLSLYGVAKLASECLGLEYAEAFDFPVWINRCGVLAGAGQFGKADQGIFSFWIHSYRARRPLTFIGFGGEGWQVRDCLHPRDLLDLVVKQLRSPSGKRRINNIGGGMSNAMSLRQLNNWCATRFGDHEIAHDIGDRRFDVPWLVLDSTRAATDWDWRRQTPLDQILEEIAVHAEAHPEWLDLTS